LVYATAVDSRGKESVWSNIIYFTVGAPAAPQITGEAAEEKQPVSEEVRDFVALARLYEVDKRVTISDKDLNRLEELLAKKNELNLATAEIRSLENLLKGKLADKKASEEEKGKGEAPKEEQATGTPDEIEDIIAGSLGTTTQQSGLIDESQEQQSKLKLNLIIFILFLIAVVVWIFWVNRELIKERRERNLAEGDEAKKDKDPDDMFKN
jgi:cbb3-type cytochrome oxidase subunit 3